MVIVIVCGFSSANPTSSVFQIKPNSSHVSSPALLITWSKLWSPLFAWLQHTPIWSPGFIPDAFRPLHTAARTVLFNLVMSIPGSKPFNHFPSYSEYSFFYSDLRVCARMDSYYLYASHSLSLLASPQTAHTCPRASELSVSWPENAQLVPLSPSKLDSNVLFSLSSSLTILFKTLPVPLFWVVFL